MEQLPPALAAFATRAQFVCWFAAPHPHKPGKFNKFPCDWRTGEVIDAHDLQYWVDANTALRLSPRWDRGHGHGAGFVFTELDPFFFVDGDSMLLPDGTWSPLAQEITARLQGAACEISHSGRGLHWFGTMSRSIEHACKNTPMGLELYTSGRFVALTGIGAQGDAAADCTDALTLLAAQYFPPSATGDFAGWSTEPVPEWKGPADDADLIARARASATKSAALAFGTPGDGKPTFEDLWTANGPVLGKEWPHEHNAFDHSNADMALANHLAFWTGKNCERIERLMRMSALARPKWDTHRTYMGDTILKACAFVSNVAQGRGGVASDPVAIPPVDPEVLADAAAAQGRRIRTPGREYMGPLEQLEHFAGCYFISRYSKVFSLRDNALYQQSAFDVIYGGHLFVIDPLGQKTSDSAWEAFTKSRVNAPSIGNDLCFRPELEPGAVVTEGMRTWVNSYVPYNCPVAAGDPSPFLNHLVKMLPNEADRRVLMHYLASCAQNPGHKFQWWPVIQGAKGNGKTLIVALMTYVMGEQYTHLPNAHAMARDGLKFNSWVDRKLFIGVEEISLQNKRDFLDEFKVIVTNLRIPLEGKGKDQESGDNRANGILMTNHKDGVPIDPDERRYAVFYCAQQTAADLVRDGMDGDYFPYLYEWCRNGGFAIMAGHLKSMLLEAKLDPARLAQRAPSTSSLAEAVRSSLGRAEQEVLDAIEEGRPGFANGWVSSKYLDKLLDDIRAPVPRSKRRAMMQSLGFDWHPVLTDGRVNDVVSPDASKPKLYLKHGHVALNFTSPAEIAKAYTKAQEPGVVTPSAAVLAFAPPAPPA